MKQTRQIKQLALSLAVVYLFMSGWMTLRTEGHLLAHERPAHHATQHTSLTCSWMCATSTFVHSADQRLGPAFHRSFEKPHASEARSARPLSLFSFHIRPPPASL